MLGLENVLIRQGAFSLAADFEVQAGRRVAVIGPSGAGKSTLLAAISGFVDLAAGAISWNGQLISSQPPGLRPVSMLFQDNNLFPHLSVAQNVGLGLSPSLRLAPQDHHVISAALDRVGLNGYEQRLPAALSGGQQSRVALARVLLQDRPIVALDEPFAALGPALRQDMLDLVAALIAEIGATLLMVTHAPHDVGRIADDVIYIDQGQAMAPQPAADLLNDPPPAMRAYLG